MLQLSNSILNRPVLSLRTNTPIATAIRPIFNPNNLKVEGFYCQDRFSKDALVLLYQDIRDIIPQGFAVNDHDVLTHPDELVRLKDILALNFELIGKPVETISRDKVGKVSDFAVETETMYVQKLYVSQSLLKSFTGGALSVDRSQIHEITSRKIIINDLLAKNAVPAPAALA